MPGVFKGGQLSFGICAVFIFKQDIIAASQSPNPEEAIDKALKKQNRSLRWQKLNDAGVAEVKSSLSIPENVNPYDLIKGETKEADTEKDPLGLGI